MMGKSFDCNYPIFLFYILAFCSLLLHTKAPHLLIHLWYIQYKFFSCIGKEIDRTYFYLLLNHSLYISLVYFSMRYHIHLKKSVLSRNYYSILTDVYYMINLKTNSKEFLPLVTIFNEVSNFHMSASPGLTDFWM